MPSARPDVPHLLPSGRRTGWQPEPVDPRDLMFDAKRAARARGLSMPKGMPRSVDLRQDGTLPPVKDQGNLGSCTANGWSVAVEEYYNRVQSSFARTAVSRLQIYYNERALEGSVNSDSGAYVRDGIKSIAQLGVAQETDWPYDISQFTVKPPQQAYDDAIKHQALTYAFVESDGAQWHIKQALAARTPVVFGFIVTPEYEAVGPDGVMKTPPANAALLGGHCTVLVGYETLPKSRKVYGITQGSWGSSFGDQGFIYIPMAWLTARNQWNSDDYWAIQSMEV